MEAVSVHCLQLVWCELMIHRNSICSSHKLTLRTHWTAMNKALDSLVSHLWHLLVCEELRVRISHQATRRLAVWMIVHHTLVLL